MCWAASRPSLPVTSWNEIRYQDMNAPARMTTGSRSPDEMRLPNDCSDRDRFSRASIHGRAGSIASEHVHSLFPSDQSVERRSSGALSALAGSDLACSDLRLGLHRLELGALDRRRLDPRRYFGACVSRRATAPPDDAASAAAPRSAPSASARRPDGGNRNRRSPCPRRSRGTSDRRACRD